jgi:mannitol/fructose-specific phosphotransferase system IIA component (Ntr-type)
MDVLSKLADLIEDPEDAKKIWEIDSVDKIYELFS